MKQKLIGSVMSDFIQSQLSKLVKKEDQVDFLQDIVEDLAGLNPQRIAGLGVTIEQLNDWKNL